MDTRASRSCGRLHVSVVVICLLLMILGTCDAREFSQKQFDAECVDQCNAFCDYVCKEERVWRQLIGPNMCGDAGGRFNVCGTKGDKGWTHCENHVCYQACSNAMDLLVGHVGTPVWNTNNMLTLNCITTSKDAALTNCFVKKSNTTSSSSKRTTMADQVPKCGVKEPDPCDKGCKDKCSVDCKKNCFAEGFWLDLDGPQVCVDICETECSRTGGSIAKIESPMFKQCDIHGCYEPCAAGIDVKKEVGAKWNACILLCITRNHGWEPEEIDCNAYDPIPCTT